MKLWERKTKDERGEYIVEPQSRAGGLAGGKAPPSHRLHDIRPPQGAKPERWDMRLSHLFRHLRTSAVSDHDREHGEDGRTEL